MSFWQTYEDPSYYDPEQPMWDGEWEDADEYSNDNVDDYGEYSEEYSE